MVASHSLPASKKSKKSEKSANPATPLQKAAGASNEQLLAKVFSQYKPLANKAIEKFVARKYGKKEFEYACGKPRYAHLPLEASKALSEPIWDLLDRGGKRWRPALMFLTIGALGKKPEDFADFAVIPEVVHNGTLMVDDIEDNSDLRRGKPCTHLVFGVDVAINAGSAMYFLPLLAVIKNKKNLGDKKACRIMQVYGQDMINLSLGQGTDILWHKGISKKVSQKEYLQMCAFKTGSLARMSAKIGAVLADASEKQVESAGAFAEAIGVAFQIQDDILNLVANEGEYGKEIGGDISEAKQTLMVIHALEKAPLQKSARLREILSLHTKDQALVREAIAIIASAGSIDFAKMRAKEIVEKAWKDFEKSLKPSPFKDKLRAFADYLIERSA